MKSNKLGSPTRIILVKKRTHQRYKINQRAAAFSPSSIVSLVTVTRYVYQITLFIWQFSDWWVKMVVADGLAPFSSQGICNNLDDISHLVRSVCVCVGGG